MNFLLQQCGTNNPGHSKDADQYLILKEHWIECISASFMFATNSSSVGGAISLHDYAKFMQMTICQDRSGLDLVIRQVTSCR